MRSKKLLTLLFVHQLFFPATSYHIKNIAQEYCSIAQRYEEFGNQSKAFDCYRKALELDPENSTAYAYFGTKEQQEIPTTQKEEQSAQKEFDLGLSFFNQEQWQEAITHFTRVISLDPYHKLAYLHLGSSYEKLNKYNDAIATYMNAIHRNNNFFEAYQRLGFAYRHIEQLEHAADIFQKAYDLQPKNLNIIMELANTLNMLDKNHESLELYQKILDINPHAISALYNFGYTLKKMGLYKRALDVYQQVLLRKPDYGPVHFSLSSIYLILGDYEKGWEEHEWRWNAYNEQPIRFNRPVWQGEDLNGKTLLVYAEQGLGDTLQFVRFLKNVKERYPQSRIILECQDPLYQLLKPQPYIDHLFKRSEKPSFASDYQIALLSIPRILKTRVDSIPTEIPYINVPEHLIAYWKEKLSHDTNFKIGICWQGNARYSTLALRKAVASKSIALELLAPLFQIPNVSIYSLQQVDGIDQIANCSFKDNLKTFDASFDQKHGRFMDTAAVMKNLDLVISVDTGICHLAGALGVSTWIILQKPNDWRWLLERSDSPWYPNVRLFRQPEPGDWKSVVAAVKDALCTQLHTKKTDPSYLPSTEQHHFFKKIFTSASKV